MKVREVSPLRQKTVDVMTMKGLSPVTQKHYLREIAKFDRHTGHHLVKCRRTMRSGTGS